MRPIMQFERKKRFAVTVAIGAALLLAMFAPSASAETQTVTTPFTTALLSPCNAEVVVLTGVFHVTADVTTDRVRIMTISSELDGTGGSTGLNYHGTLRDETVTDIGPLPAQEVAEEHMVLNTQTSLDNFEMFVNVHILVDESGPHTVVDVERTQCRG